jgi:hypothetical protein
MDIEIIRSGAESVDDNCHLAPNPTWAWRVGLNYGVGRGTIHV